MIASFLLAAIISPYLYQIGKGFANVALTKDTTDEVTWLASRAERADFAAYFWRGFLISALICLAPLFYTLDLRRHARQRRKNPWTVGIPPNHTPPRMGQPLKKIHWGILQSFVGFCLASAFFCAMAWFVFELNWFEWERHPTKAQFWQLIAETMRPAILMSLLEELCFRGILLGIFLRAFRPSIAIISLSLLFAAIHFLMPTGDGIVSNPRAPEAGFEMLILVSRNFLESQAVIHTFIGLFFMGLILGAARVATAALWLPFGLHAGWIFCATLFATLANRRANFPDDFHFYMGKELTQGIVPIATLIMTGIVLALYLRFIHTPRKSES